MKRLARHRWPGGTVLLALTMKQGLLFEDLLTPFESSKTVFAHPDRTFLPSVHRLYGISSGIAEAILDRLAESKGAPAREIERQIISELKAE